jgi:predicted phosphodiesterase
MRIHLLSDLHLEFASYAPQVHDADVTVLAGDIHTKGRSVAWALAAFPGRVLVVPGNHEYYGGHLQRTLAKMRGMANGRVQVLDRDNVVIDGVRFLGATAWTDFRCVEDWRQAQSVASQRMNDYRMIRCLREGREFARLTPAVLAAEAAMARLWLREQIAIPHPGPTVVITHHAPSVRSLPGERIGEAVDASYANSWDDLFDPAVVFWLHGHTHYPVDYMANVTRVVSNPRGYPGEESERFNPDLVLEIPREAGIVA